MIESMLLETIMLITIILEKNNLVTTMAMEGLVFIEGEQSRTRNIHNRPAPGRITDEQTDDTAHTQMIS